MREGAPIDDIAPLLEVTGLRTYFRTPDGVAKAVDGVDLTLKPGQMRSIIGESGCGKSVIALSIMRLIGAPGWIAGGSIRLQGRDLLHLPEEEMRQIRAGAMAMIFQDSPASRIPADIAGHTVITGASRRRMVSQRAALEREREVCRLVGLPPLEQLISMPAARVSADMRRRLLIARALAQQPTLLIADEPTAGLDETSRTHILTLIKSLQATAHSAVLLITHDLGMVAAMADEITVLYAGQVVEQGTVGAVLTQPKHPYTVGLLHSTPIPGQRDPRLQVLPGGGLDAVRPPAGCPFAPRCPHVMVLCREQAPLLREVAEGSRARCWLY